MTTEADSSVTFVIGESGDVEWFFETGRPDLTTEQAMVIVHARGLFKVASAIENLALALDTRAERLSHPDDA